MGTLEMKLDPHEGGQWIQSDPLGKDVDLPGKCQEDTGYLRDF